MSLYPTKSYPITKGPSEFEILKASHKFLREEDLDSKINNPTSLASNKTKTWEEQLAERYYQSLYKEFALCDLKHYKSGQFALRWRTETEVISELGESTCANTRCKYHHPLPTSTSATILFDKKMHKKNKSKKPKNPPQLTTLELPFTYIEQEESKSALVKVVLCPRCVKKLMWKRTKEKEDRERTLNAGNGNGSGSKDKKEEEVGVGGGVSDDSSDDDSEGGDELKKVDIKGKAREKDEKEKETKFRSEAKVYARLEERLLDSHSRSREDRKKRYEHVHRHHSRPGARSRSPKRINTPDIRPRSRSPRRIDAHTHYRKRPRSP